MVKDLFKFIFVAVIGLALTSCAKEVEESNRDIQERILDAYLQVNAEKWPNAKKYPSGLTILKFKQGEGEPTYRRTAVYVDYTLQGLDGTVTETTYPEVAKRIGTYTPSEYFGPQYMEIGFNSTYKGLEELLLMMNEGAEATFILPPWLTYKDSLQKGNTSSQVNGLYELKCNFLIKDIVKYEKDTIQKYVRKNYIQMDTLPGGIYFKKLYESGGDSLKTQVAQVRYVGKLLDGFVFDTNIEDTARKYGIYNKDNDYEPLSVDCEEDFKSMAENTSLVAGFCKALLAMSVGDVAVTIFNSDYGYTFNGKDPIGPYQPLQFWLYVESAEK